MLEISNDHINLLGSVQQFFMSTNTV